MIDELNKQDTDDVRALLDMPEGARFFCRLLDECGVALEKAIRYFPLAGLLVGGIAALAFMASAHFWPKPLAVLFAIATVVYLTGALHEDGWSDMADGFGGGWDRQRILDIMRDSRLGSFGAVALVILLLMRVFALLEIDAALLPLALIAGHAFSRLCPIGIMAARWAKEAPGRRLCGGWGAGTIMRLSKAKVSRTRRARAK